MCTLGFLPAPSVKLSSGIIVLYIHGVASPGALLQELAVFEDFVKQ
jgi:hypothetical protein